MQGFIQFIRRLRNEIGALYLASKRVDIGLAAKVISILVVAYALSPIDLIPDFIPILGYLDDFILLPLGIGLAISLMPNDVMQECREQSEGLFQAGKPKNWMMAGCIVLLWILIILRLVGLIVA